MWFEDKIRHDLSDRSTDERLLLLYALRKTSTLGCPLDGALESDVVERTREASHSSRVTQGAGPLLKSSAALKSLLRSLNGTAASNLSREERYSRDLLIKESDNMSLPPEVKASLHKDSSGHNMADIRTWRQLKDLIRSVDSHELSPAKIRDMQSVSARRTQRDDLILKTMKRRVGPRQNSRVSTLQSADKGEERYFDQLDRVWRCSSCHWELPEAADEDSRNTCPACGLQVTAPQIEQKRLFPGMHKLNAERSLRATGQHANYNETPEEEDNNLPVPRRQVTSHLQEGSTGFNQKLAAYVTDHVTIRDSAEQVTHDPSLQETVPYVMDINQATHTPEPRKPEVRRARRRERRVVGQPVERKRVDVSFWT